MAGLARGDDLVLDTAGQVDRDGERQALEAARLAVDLRIDADHFAARVEQRAARVAGVDGHVRLDERHIAVVRQGTTLGTDDAGRHRAVEAIRGTDGQHPLAHFQVARMAERHDGQVVGVDFQHGDIGLRIRAQHLGAEFAAVVELDGHFARIAHHVGVRHDDAVGADDEAGTKAMRGHVAATALPALRPLEAAEEFEEGVVAEVVIAGLGRRVVGHLGAARDADIDDGRAVTRGDLAKVWQGHQRRGSGGRHGGSHGSAWGSGSGIRAGIVLMHHHGATGAQHTDRGQRGYGAFDFQGCGILLLFHELLLI
ncbi:hypothetical protein D3C72_1195170 [compost metagenome]